MNKQLKFVFVTLIVLVGALSFSTAFLFASRGNKSVETGSKKVESVSTTPTPEPQNTQKSNSDISKPTNSSEEPSHPSKVYTIKQKETLFSIAKDNGYTMNDLAEVNGISDSDKVQAGQVIVIAGNGLVEYTLDIDQMKILQNKVNNGKDVWRLDPLKTANADAPIIFGLKVNDTYSLVNEDNNNAKVKVQSENGSYEITLIQGETKGDKGIWAISLVKKM